jgi:hypothetical protein
LIIQLSQIIYQFGESSPNWIDVASSIHSLTESTSPIIGGIQPDYGPSTSYYSASIPFVVSGVGLWSPGDKPFLVSYQLSANVVQPEIVNKIDFNDTKQHTMVLLVLKSSIFLSYRQILISFCIPI